MTLLLSRCEQIVLHATGLQELPAEVSVLECVNRAGAWIYAQPWKWTERLGSVNTVAAQAWVACPADLRAIISAQTANWGLDQTSLDEINELRAQSIATSYPALYALVDSLSAAGVYTKRLELYPTPTSIAAVRLFYRAGWQTPQGAADTARIAVPEDWEGLFSEALVATAMGIQERDIGAVDVRLESLRRSDLYARLVRQDGMSQSNYGPMRNGGVAMQMGYGYWPRQVTNAIPPS